MATKISVKLSQDYTQLLESEEYYDVTINVGKERNTKIFKTHKNILCYRSPYLKRVLSSNTGNSAPINLPNISPGIFKIVLKHIYGGIVSLDGEDGSNILEILVAADELLLQDLVDHIQKYLIENKSSWMEQHFKLIHQTSFQSNYFLELQQFCTDFMVQFPEKIFKSFDFTTLPEKSLVSLIKRDDLQMKEIEIWEHVLKWSLAQNSNLVPDPDTWLDDGLKSMKNTLQTCLPLIRFYSLSSKEFLHRVIPYNKLLDHQLYKDLLNSYMDPDVKPNESISLPRSLKIDGIIDSKIVNLNIVSLISRWIDKADANIKFSQFRELYLPYKFQLLLRGSRDGFTPKRFHELCDDKPCTVTFIKIKGTGEIIGGYNPTVWLSSGGWGKIKDSFIFFLKSEKEFFKDPILSKVKDYNHALNRLLERHGPFFGGDILIYSEDSNTNYSTSYCQQTFYEKKIRNTKNNFSMEDYEVFQLIN